jgi:hypothetical protein
MVDAPYPTGEVSMRGLERFAPLTGVVFVILVVVAVIVGGETPDANDGIVKVVDYWRDNDGKAIASAIIAAYSAVFFLWFAGTLRSVLASAEGPPTRLASTAWGGAIVLTVGWVILIGATFVAADTAGDVAPQVTQTLSVLQADFFFPLSVGAGVFLLASGLNILRWGALPAWLGWAAVVLGVAAISPVGFFAIVLMLVWILVVSVVLFQSSRDERPMAVPPPQGQL